MKDQVLIRRFADDAWGEPVAVPGVAGAAGQPCLPMRIAPGTKSVPLVWSERDELRCVKVELK